MTRVADSKLIRAAQAAIVGLVTVLTAVPGWSQLPAAPKIKGAVEPAADAVKEAAGQARKAGRDTAKDARGAAKNAREAARDATEDARKGAADTAKGARREAREAGREAGRAVRRGAREFTADNVRAADLGVWFNSRAGTDGLIISDVAAQGAIAKIGFQEGDRIVSINGTPVRAETDFVRLLLADDVRSDRVPVIVLRDGREQTLYVQPALLYDEIAWYDPFWQYGLVIDDRYPDRLVVLRVYPRTPAYYAGLRAGDVIVSAGGDRIAAVNDFSRIIADAEGPLALQVTRANRTRELQLDTSAALEGGARATLRPEIKAETEGRATGRTEGRIEGRKGTAPAADDPSGTRPRLEKQPKADTPRSEKPAPTKPGAPKPRADKPDAEKPDADKPDAEKPDAGGLDVPAPAPKTPAAPKTPRVSKP
jgi:membrane-associated protease RseP (regulator of RpoE activity)